MSLRVNKIFESSDVIAGPFSEKEEFILLPKLIGL